MFGGSKHREKKVTSLQGYIGEISSIREQWLANPDDELWFRGEDDKHRDTTLLPELYRTDKPTDKVLEMESRLFDEFKRCGVQYSEFNTEDEWNWYSPCSTTAGRHGSLTGRMGHSWPRTSACALRWARVTSKMTP